MLLVFSRMFSYVLAYVTRMHVLLCYLYVLVCCTYILICYSHVLACYSYVLVCYLYVLVCCTYVTRMFSYVTCMYSYVARMYSCVTRMYSRVTRMYSCGTLVTIQMFSVLSAWLSLVLCSDPLAVHYLAVYSSLIKQSLTAMATSTMAV